MLEKRPQDQGGLKSKNLLRLDLDRAHKGENNRFSCDRRPTVARLIQVTFDAPIKLVFPQNVFDATSRSSMLGLGDIVIPGIMIALMLRFDNNVS